MYKRKDRVLAYFIAVVYKRKDGVLEYFIERQGGRGLACIDYVCQQEEMLWLPP